LDAPRYEAHRLANDAPPVGSSFWRVAAPRIEQRVEAAEEPELERWGEALLTAPSLEAIFGQ